MSTLSPSKPNSTLGIRKGVERPKPLKPSSVILPSKAMAFNEFPINSAEEVLNLFEYVVNNLTSGKHNAKTPQAIVALNSGLKSFGSHLDQHHKDSLDKYQVVIRNSCKDGSLDLVSRLQLLEIIELRAMKWKQNDSVANYYKHKLLQVEQCDVLYQHGPAEGSSKSSSLNASAPDFNPLSNSNYLATATASLTSLLSVGSNNSDSGKVTMNSGKFERTFKPPGKAQVKDEVVIRNSDSGKVMGVKGKRVHLIEQMSDCVISFQKVDLGAKERLVQILGPDEEKIDNAKHLINETIRRNQSPDPGGLEMYLDMEDGSGDSAKTFMFTVEVGENDTDCLKVHGNNHELVKTAKLVLDDYFAKQTKGSEVNNNMDGDDLADEEPKRNCFTVQPICLEEKRLVYDRRVLLSYSKSPFCRQEPVAWSSQWESMVAENPGLLRNVKLSKVSDVDGEVEPEQLDYFKPTPEQFMYETPRFPPGFVVNYQPFNPNNNNNQPRNKELSHLDKLFVKSSGGAISSRLNVDGYVVGVKYWNDERGEWVTDGPGTR